MDIKRIVFFVDKSYQLDIFSFLCKYEIKSEFLTFLHM